MGLHRWYIWAYYISPFAYCLRAVVINEMTSPQWAAPIYPGSTRTIGQVNVLRPLLCTIYWQPPPPPYAPALSHQAAAISGPFLFPHLHGVLHVQAALLSFDFFLRRFWIWIGILYALACFVLLTAASALALRLVKPPKERATTEEEIKEKTRQSMRQLDTSKQPHATHVACTVRCCSVHHVAVSIALRFALPAIAISRHRRWPGQAAASLLSARVNAAGVSQGAAASSVAEEGGEAAMEAHLTFTPITLVLRDVKYFVDAPSKEAARVSQSGMEGKLELLKVSSRLECCLCLNVIDVKPFRVIPD